MTEVYCHPTIRALQDHYKKINNGRRTFKTIYAYLDAFSNRMYEGVISRNKTQLYELSNYHPEFIGLSVEELRLKDITLEHCKDCIAFQYGYSEWQKCAAQSKIPFDYDFEDAVDFILNGELKSLRSILMSNPHLIEARSRFGHKAGLIHYCGNNGLEFWRQQVPLNLNKIFES